MPEKIEEIEKQLADLEHQFAMRHLPSYMWEATQMYIAHGVKPGDFLVAIFKNQFLSIVAHADPVNMERLKSWAMFLHNYMPGGSVGSIVNYRKWSHEGGLYGKEKLRIDKESQRGKK